MAVPGEFIWMSADNRHHRVAHEGQPVESVAMRWRLQEIEGNYTLFYPDRARLDLEGRWGWGSLSDCTGLGLR